MIPNGWTGVIGGIILSLIVFFMWSSSHANIESANNIRANGYLYRGTSTITAEEYETIKDYHKDSHSGLVEVISLTPYIEVDYHFGSLEVYPFLTTIEWGLSSKLKQGFTEPLLIIASVIPLLMIFKGLMTLGSKKPTKES